MSTTTDRTAGAAGRRYLDAAATELDDLPVGEREELLSDIADAIAEAGSSSDEPVEFDELVERFGRPEAFAEEIRISSGAAARTTRMDETVGVELGGPSALERAAAQVTGGLRWMGVELEPVWWMLRAVAVVSVIVVVLVIGVEMAFLWSIPAVVASVVHGARQRQRSTEAGLLPERHAVRRGVGIVAASFVAFAALLVVQDRMRWDSSAYYDEGVVMVAPSGLTSANGDVSNVYAFDVDGNRIEDVRLFDQGGAPLDVGESSEVDVLRRPARASDGGEVLNAFPIRYLDPETGRVDDPAAGWPASPGPLSSGRATEGATSSIAPMAPATPDAEAAPINPATGLPAGSAEPAAEPVPATTTRGSLSGAAARAASGR